MAVDRLALQGGGRRLRPGALSARSAAAPLGFAVLALLASLVFARLVADGHSRAALGLGLLVPIGLVVLRRPQNGLLIGSAFMIPLPYWVDLGPSLTSAFHVGVLFALASCFMAVVAPARLRVRINLVDRAVVALAIAALLSWAWTDPTKKLLQATVNAILPLSFYFAARLIAVKPFRVIAGLLFGAGAAGALTVYFEFFVTHHPLFSDPRGYLWGASTQTIFRPGGVFGSPPAAAGILSMTTLLGLSLFRREGGKSRLLVSVLVLLGAGAILATFTRAGIIGFCVGGLVYVLLSQPIPRRALQLITVALVVFLIGAFTLPRLEASTSFQQGVLRKGTFGARISYWHEAWPMITDSSRHLFLGHGFNSLVVVNGEVPGKVDAEIAASPDLRARGPHNQYVRTLLEEGLIGFGLLMLWLLGAMRLGVVTLRRAAARHRCTIAAYVGAITSLVVVSTAGDSLRHPGTLAVAALITGSLVTYCQAISAGDDAE
jgi:O-antigen ligase